MKHWSESLSKLNTCADAVAYCAGHPSIESAWSSCERGDWMLWYAGRISGDVGSSSRLKVVAAAVECAEIALPLSVRTCIETTRAYINGVATYTAYAAACANASAACADAALESKRKETLKQCADIVRRHYTTPPTSN